MGFTENKKNQIKRYMLEKIGEGNKDVAKKAVEAFGVSYNTVYRYLRELQAERIIRKNGNKNYVMIEKTDYVSLKRSKEELVDEDIIYDRYIHRYIEPLPDNVRMIWEYSFMEMMNNAIDHSQAEHVQFLIIQNYTDTSIILTDDGVGIFRKIKDFYGYHSLDDAVNELFKGKLTTDRKNHSGEGIFFTSRMLDFFGVFSDGKIFTHDKYTELIRDLHDIAPLKKWKDDTGTTIYMKLSNDSKRLVKEVFDMFSDVDGGFTRTRIPLKNVYETYPVSRSQAKRLCNGFERFREIELDFSEVEEIGQGFAHQIFCVFQNEHPEIKLLPLNTSEEVKKMIHHVKSS